MTVQAWFSSTDVDVVPGATAVITLTVANLGGSTESFALAPAGLAAGWTTIRPGYVTLFGGSEESVDVEVRPPRLPSTTAGPVALGVRIVPQATPDDVTSAETTLHIGATHDRSITTLQPALRTRRRATFELMLENQGNSLASCRLHLIDPSHRLDGDFDPPAVGVEPGGTALVRLKVRAAKRQWERRSRSMPFRVDADQQGADTVTAQATLVQAPVIPERLLPRLAALLLLAAALTGAWFGIVKPYIDRSAERAAEEREPVPATTVAITTPGDDPPPPPTTTVVSVTPSVPVEPRGTNFSASLPTEVARGEQQANQYTVPADSTLDVTDLLVQNPFGDQGVVRVRVGNIALTYNLINLEGFDAVNQWVTPIRLQPGEAVTVEVTCSEVGQQGAGACAPTVVVGGVLLPSTAAAGTTTTSAPVVG